MNDTFSKRPKAMLSGTKDRAGSPRGHAAAARACFLPLLLLLFGSFLHGETDGGEGDADAQDRHYVYFLTGERLAGTHVEDDGGHIHFESDALGTLRIAKERIDRIEYPGLPDSTLPADEAAHQADPTPVEETGGTTGGDGYEAETEKPVETDLANVATEPPEEPEEALTAMETVERMPAQELPPTPTVWEDNPFFRAVDRYNPIAHWDSQIQFGFTLNFGNVDQQDWSIRFQTIDRHHPKRNQRVELSWEYGTRKNAAGETFRWRDRKRGLYRFRYNFADRFYWQAATRYRNEPTIGIQHEIDQTTGVGYTFVDSRRWKGSATPSLGAQYRDIRGRESEWVAIFSFFQDLEYTFNNRTSVRQTFSIDVYPKDDYAVSANFATVLDNELSDRLRLNLRYEFDYNGLARPGVTRDQQTVSLSLATTF